MKKVQDEKGYANAPLSVLLWWMWHFFQIFESFGSFYLFYLLKVHMKLNGQN